MDFGNLVFGADTSELVTARTEMGRVTDQAGKTEAAVDGLTGATERLAIEAKQTADAEKALTVATEAAGERTRRATTDLKAKEAALRAQVDAITGVTRSTSGASDSTRDWVAQLQRQDAAFDDLRSSLDPIYASTRRYEAAVEQVNAAVAAGIVTQQEASRVVDLAGKRYLGAATGVEALGIAQARVSGISGNMTSAVTNASFQIQDFAVQVAGGTAATTALAQQLPQLLGAFGFSGVIGLVGAALGTLVAVAVPVARALFGAADGAKALDERMENLAGAIGSYTESARLAGESTTDLRARFGEYAEDVRAFALFQAQIDLGKAQAGMVGSAKAMSEGLDTVLGKLDAVKMRQELLSKATAGQAAGVILPVQFERAAAALTTAQEEAAAAAKTIGMTVDQVKNLDAAFKAFEGARGMADIRDTSGEALAAIMSVTAGMDTIPPHLAAAATEMVKVNLAATEGALAMEGAVTGASNLSDAMTKAATATFSALSPVHELEKTYGALAGTVRQVLEAQNAVARSDFQAQMAGLATQMGKLADEANNYDAIIRNVANNGSLDQQAVTYAEIARLIEGATGGVARMDSETRSVYESLLSASMQAAEMSDAAAGAAVNLDSGSRAAGGLTGSLGQAVGMAAQLVSILGQVPSAVAAMAGQVDAAVGAIQRQNATLTYQVQQGLTAGAANIKALRDEAVRVAIDGGATIDQAAKVGQEFDKQAAKVENLSRANEGLNSTLADQAKALAGGGGGGGGRGGGGRGGGGGGGVSAAAKAASEGLDKLRASADAWQSKTATPIEKYRKELAELDALLNAKGSGLSPETYRRAVEQLNGELARSNPIINDVASAFGDFVAGGLKDFRGFVSTILGSFKSMLAKMITTAAANPIQIAMGMTGGAAGTAAAGGMGGPLGGLMGGASALMGGIGTGMGSVASGLLSGGLGGAGSAISTAIGGATTGMAGLGAAIGAVAAPLLAVGAIFMAFKTKTKLLDSGLRVTVDGLTSAVETFEKLEKSKFFGLSKKKSTNYSAADAEIADPISQAIDQIITGIGDGAAALGLKRSGLEGLDYDFKLSTKGKSDAEIQSMIEGELAGLGDAAVRAIAGTAIDRFQASGEKLGDTLNRLVGNLGSANEVLDLLGRNAMDASVSGAAAATAMAAAVGGFDNLASSAATYMQEFWSEGERMENATRRVTASFGALGVAMPQSRAEFRAITDAIDTTSEAGAELYGKMIGLAGAFAAVTPAAGLLTPALDELRVSLIGQIDGMIASITEMQTSELRAAREWKTAADRIKGFVADMRGTVGNGRTGKQARSATEAEYQILLARAVAGDRQAVSEVTAVADRLIGLGADQAKTQLEAQMVSGRVLNNLKGIGVLADIEAERHALMAGILGAQVDILTEVRDVLMRGDELTAGKVAELQGKVIGIGKTIADAEKASMDVLKGYAAAGLDRLAAMKEVGTTGRYQFEALKGLQAIARTIPGGVAGALDKAFGETMDKSIAGFSKTLSGPLSNVVKGLDTLRTGLATNADRIKSAIDRQTLVMNLNAAIARRENGIAAATGVVARIRGLEASTGGVIQNDKGQASKFVVDQKGVRTPNGDMAWVEGDADALAAFRKDFWGAGGLQSQLWGASKSIIDEGKTIEKLREQIAAFGGIPKFEKGGDHAGGVRLVGERGPEIEATGPARYMSATKTRDLLKGGNDDGELVSEVRALRSEMRQLGMAQVKHTRDTARTLKGWDVIGQPEVRANA